MALTRKAGEVHPWAALRPGADRAFQRGLFQGKALWARSPRQGDLEKEEGGDDSGGHASRAKGSNAEGTGIEHGRERKAIDL